MQHVTSNNHTTAMQSKEVLNCMGDTVWLDIPTAGKLDPKWQGGWRVKVIQDPTTYVITDGKTDRAVHINRQCKRIQPAPTPTTGSAVDIPCEVTWNPPMTEHEIVESEEERRYPQRDRRAPDYFHF